MADVRPFTAPVAPRGLAGSDAADTLAARLTEFDQLIRRYAQERPLATVLAAAAAGYLVSRVVSRL